MSKKRNSKKNAPKPVAPPVPGTDETLENEVGNMIVLVDENEEEAAFEVMAMVEYQDANYVVLYPLDDEDEDSSLVILQVASEADMTEGAYDPDEALEAYLPVEDEETLQAVYDLFVAEFPDLFEDEE